MKSKGIFISFSFVFFFLILFFIFIFPKLKSKPKLTQENDQLTQNAIESNPPQRGQFAQTTPSEAKLLNWSDQAGFIFNYPADLKVDKHPEDNISYANLDFSYETGKNLVKVLAVDSKYKTLDEWAKKDKQAVGGSAIDGNMAGKAAKKIIFDSTGKIVIGIIDDSILFTVEVSPDKEGKLQKVFDTITSSFALVTPTPAKTQTGTSTNSSSDIIEEEEVVE